ncbi:TERF1-interacting nuclear factor 2 isoform X2 [Trichomycterus rosablanca]|uniref:TERF1-interacting nuclear factor 2 isoform X2 n=1 Tax=Trichomycterus rosablanca TaxID=2290929 RepID=UPI002F357BBE
MITEGQADNNNVASLRLLVPPLRLVSAAMWKVMQQRDVMHYGKLVEFLTSISESVPGLLTYRHQAKLTIGLQSRLILEQLRVSQSPDPKLIFSQLEKLHAPVLPDKKKKDQKVETAVKNFHALVQTLHENPARRKQFFQEEFASQYGAQYDSALEKLMWEFLTRLDQLLPVPDLTQTVSWLTSAPAVLEECARSASQPQLLRTLLQHEKCLGHVDSAGSVPSSIGDSILSSLSLPPSGKVRDTDQSGSTPTMNIPSPTPSTQRFSRQTRRSTSQIAPVIGSITSEDLPQKGAANQKIASNLKKNGEVVELNEVSDYAKIRTRSCKERDILQAVTNEERRVGKMLSIVANQISTSSEVEDEDETRVRAVRSEECRRKSVTEKRQTRSENKAAGKQKLQKDELENSSKMDVNAQEGQNLPAVIASCVKRQSKVIVPRLSISEVSRTVLLNTTVEKTQAAESPSKPAVEGVAAEKNDDPVTRKRKLSPTSTPQKNQTGFIAKQVCRGSPNIPTTMPIRMKNPDLVSPVLESTEDIIVDSEDEAPEKMKGRLFTKRYCKTKNDTYIPTLHEFWSPSFFRRDLLSPGNGCR